MSTVEQIFAAVRKLPRTDLARFRRLFEKYEADEWHRQIERDSEAGKFDDLIVEVERDHRAGRTTKL